MTAPGFGIEWKTRAKIVCGYAAKATLGASKYLAAEIDEGISQWVPWFPPQIMGLLKELNITMRTSTCSPLCLSGLVLNVACALAASAQAFEVKYNYQYQCGNERVEVFYCRNDRGQPVPESDNYCHVEYPDRPRRMESIAVFASVLKSDLARQLANCAGPAASDPSVAKAAKAKVDTTVFGIQLGDPLNLPACPMFQVGGAGMQTCYASLIDMVGDMARQFGGASTVPANVKTVYLGANECPSWVNECTLVVTLYDGKVGAVGVFTKGPSVDRKVREVLAEKYGKWKYSRPGTVTPSNADKADIQIVSNYWELPGLFVQYQPIWFDEDGNTPDIREGLIRVETETAAKLRASAKSKAPKPKM